jgi:hypothetical protein
LASSRSLLTKDPNYKKRPFRKTGRPSKLDKALVAQVVSAEVVAPVSTKQITGLAVTLGRSRASIKKMIEDARENFVESAGDYVAIHKEATMSALARGDDEVAAKAAQWAMTNMSFEGARIVDKAASEPAGTKIMIGVRFAESLKGNPAIGVKIDD